MRRIIICCDGTWNHPDQKGRNDGPSKPSNIVKIARSILPIDSKGVSQIVFYDKGVGTGNFWDKVSGGIKGKGLDDNIVDAYRFIINNYSEGDEIFIFGFSRGAYTARSLTGFIEYIGLLPKSNSYFTPHAYQLYRDRKEDVESFRENNKSKNVNIKFVGVFDTVGAMGIPLKIFRNHNIKKYSFHNTKLGGNVKNAYHALAIDERRKPFKPTLWDDQVNPDQNMEQRWFAGVHTNIGGGYEKDGLANITLHWILTNAINVGLEINYDYINHYKPYYGHKLYDSMSFVYRLLGKNIRKINISNNQTLDKSVKSRMEHDETYNPVNISESFQYSESLRIKKED